MIKISGKTLNRMLLPSVRSYLECDGQTRVLAYELGKRKVRHQVYRGQVILNRNVFPIHYWIIVGGYFIDYKLRPIFGSEAPHGVFPQSSKITYLGQPVNLAMNEMLYKILMDGEFNTMGSVMENFKKFQK